MEDLLNSEAFVEAPIALPSNVEDFFAEMLSPGLAVPPPTDLEIRVGDSMTLPLGPTKGADQEVEVDLGEAWIFIKFDKETSILSINENALSESDVGVYQISLLVNEVNEGEDSKSGKQYKIRLNITPNPPEETYNFDEEELIDQNVSGKI